MKEKYIVIAIVLATVLIMGGGVVLVGGSSAANQVGQSQNTKVNVVDPTSYDFGKKRINGGHIVKSFTIKNTGTDTLKLFNIRTSCHCTVARLQIKGKTSQNFGMSGKSSWIGEVRAGKEAQLIVDFDPAFHGQQGVGPIQRYISVETNDASNSKLLFSLTGTVVN